MLNNNDIYNSRGVEADYKIGCIREYIHGIILQNNHYNDDYYYVKYNLTDNYCLDETSKYDINGMLARW